MGAMSEHNKLALIITYCQEETLTVHLGLRGMCPGESAGPLAAGPRLGPNWGSYRSATGGRLTRPVYMIRQA